MSGTNEASPKTPDRSAIAAARQAALSRISPQSALLTPADLDRAQSKRSFLKIINDEIVGKNPRPQALESLDLLVTVLYNALSDSSKRSIRLQNVTIKRKLVSVEGCIHYLQSCRWTSKTQNFEEHLTWPENPSFSQTEALQLGLESLQERIEMLQTNYGRTEANKLEEKQAAEARKEQTLQAIRDDRVRTAARIERERIGRETRQRNAQQSAPPISPQQDSQTSQSDKGEWSQ